MNRRSLIALEIGSVNSDSVLSRDIYQEIDILLSPPLQEAVDNAEGEAKAKAQEALDGAREDWKKLSYAIAKGVIEHIKAYMEIKGVRTQGGISPTVKRKKVLADPINHQHDVDLTRIQTGIVSVQINDGTGLVGFKNYEE